MGIKKIIYITNNDNDQITIRVNRSSDTETYGSILNRLYNTMTAQGETLRLNSMIAISAYLYIYYGSYTFWLLRKSSNLDTLHVYFIYFNSTASQISYKNISSTATTAFVDMTNDVAPDHITLYLKCKNY